ncbi:putative Terpene synthase [Seiridium unicorne]|uniref:Terpene synthase n=1 Tax=Seiridium unicorne TaxID=138068 RepID=A0ABR2V0L5_9PEZI
MARINGLGTQEAFDHTSDGIGALKVVPSWGEIISGSVRQYIQGIANVARANLNWRGIWRAMANSSDRHAA